MTLLTLKQKIKSKKPVFVRENYGALPRITNTWRKPKGIHSKLRHGFAGHRNRVEPGYGTPATLRHLTTEGLHPVLVHTTKTVDTLDPKKHTIIIAHVGMRKKTEIITYAQQKKISILNVKKPEQYLTSVQTELAERKKAQQTRKKKQEKQTKVEKKEQPQEQKDETAKKEEQKKELDKLLTKKEG